MTYAKSLIAAAVLAVGASFAAPAPSNAGTITKAQLAGPWTLSVIGDTGCGDTTLFVTFTLNAAGTGVAHSQMHSRGCGNSITTETFTIVAVNTVGTGTATLTCGTGCGWGFRIQVDAGLRLFTVVDVTDGLNFLEGTAIHR